MGPTADPDILEKSFAPLNGIYRQICTMIKVVIDAADLGYEVQAQKICNRKILKIRD
jgi:hypothetical protein